MGKSSLTVILRLGGVVLGGRSVVLYFMGVSLSFYEK